MTIKPLLLMTPPLGASVGNICWQQINFSFKAMVKSNLLLKYTLYLGSQISALLAADKMIGIED